MDVDIFNFYHAVLHDEQLYFNVTHDGLRNSFIRLKRSYNRKTLKKCKTYVNYHLPPDRCAYLYKFGPCHTQFVSVYFRKFLENARNVYSTLKKKDELKICSLGGGPGTDVVGMLSVLVSHKDLWSKLSEVTVLDVCGGWRNSFKRIIKKLEEIYPVQENLLSSLVSVDLMGTLSAAALKAIEQADILCMVKFVSTVISHSSAESAFKEIASHMKTGAVVIFIDNLDSRISKPLKKYFNESGFKCVFRDFCDHFKVQGSYSLSLKDLDGSEIMEHANIYVLGWIKKSSPESTNIHQVNFGTVLQNAHYSSNSEDNYPESDGNGSDSDSALCDPEQTDDDDDDDDVLSLDSCPIENGTSNSFRNSSELPCGVDEAKHYADQCIQTTENSGELSDHLRKNDSNGLPCNSDETKLCTDQCTQTIENVGGLSGHLGKNYIFDNLSSTESSCDIEGTKHYTDKCTQTLKFSCDKPSHCVTRAQLKALECQLSRIILRLSRMEFLIENIAVGCNKEFCGRTTCSDDHILRSDISDECHFCVNHC